MNKKKKIVMIFVLLILFTLVASFLFAIKVYNEAMAEAEELGEYKGVGLAMLFLEVMVMSVFIYEIDLFYTVYSAAIKPKPVQKTTLSILANLCLMLLTAGLLFYFLHGAAPDHNTSVIYRVVDKIEWIAFYMYLPLRLGAFIASFVSRKADEKKQKAEA
ncbi:MAG: hypothetical protein IKZ82_09505 [Clostridia bacterium]|nr:hypothetical protein [Clostridia bacterium]